MEKEEAHRCCLGWWTGRNFSRAFNGETKARVDGSKAWDCFLTAEAAQ